MAFNIASNDDVRSLLHYFAIHVRWKHESRKSSSSHSIGGRSARAKLVGSLGAGKDVSPRAKTDERERGRRGKGKRITQMHALADIAGLLGHRDKNRRNSENWLGTRYTSQLCIHARHRHRRAAHDSSASESERGGRAGTTSRVMEP